MLSKEEVMHETNAVKAGVWYTVSIVTVNAISIISTPVFTRILSIEDYGLASTYTSWFGILFTVCSMNLAYSVARAKIDYPDRLQEYIGSMQLLAGIVTASFGVFLLFGSLFFRETFGTHRNIMMVLIIHLFFAPAVDMAQTRYRYEYRYKENIFITFFTAVSTLVLSIGLIYRLQENKYWGKILGTALPTILLGFLFWYIMLKNKRMHMNFEFWKYGLALSLPLIMHNISLNLLVQADRVIIQGYRGNSETGIYSLVYQYSNLVQILTGAINGAWIPWFHDRFHQKEYSKIGNNVKPLFALAAVLSVGCVGVAPEAITILGGQDYLEGIKAVAPIVMSCLAMCVATYYLNIELHVKKTIYVAIGTSVAAVCNILLNLVFVPQFGFVAAAYTTCISYIVLFGVHYFITHYKLKINLYNVKYFIGVMLLACILLLVLQFLHEYFLIRALLIALAVILYCFIYRRDLRAILSK